MSKGENVNISDLLACEGNEIKNSWYKFENKRK